MSTRRLNIQCLTWILFLGLTATLSLPAGAQGSTLMTADEVAPGASLAIPGSQAVTGTVVTSSDTKLVISDAEGRTRDFALDPAGSFGAAMLPGDEVRVRYDRIESGADLAKDVQTLNVTERLSREERQREMYAMSQPPTEGSLTAEATSLAQASTEPEAATGSPAGDNPAEDGTPEELPATASQMPLMAGAGLLALGAGVGIGLVIRRTVRRA